MRAFVSPPAGANTDRKQLQGAFGVRISADGESIIISENTNRRVSIYTIGGDFVKTIGAGGPLKSAQVRFCL